MKAPIFAVVGCLAAVSLFGCAEKPEAQANTEPPKSSEATKAPEPTKPAEETGKLPTEPKDGEDVAVIETDKGRIIFMFYPQKAPKHVENFKSLAAEKFYDGTRFHRCIEGFMIQGGDPNSSDMGKAALWGSGGKVVNGKERLIPAEFTDVHHSRGVVSMARSSDPNSASSQFFIVQANSPNLDGQYTAFGYAVSGMDVVDAIVKTGDANDNGKVKPENAVLVKSIRIEKWPVK